MAAATERWGLHRRFALGVVNLVGTESSRLVLAFMFSTAFASMWLSNTATAVMMLPIASAVLTLVKRESPSQATSFGSALMLGVAYSASIGGVATLIGTPPNAIFAGALHTMVGQSIGFAEWMVVGVPVAIVMLLLAWILLVRVLHRVKGQLQGIAEHLKRERKTLGPWSKGEILTALVFAAAACSWILREPKEIGSITIPGIASFIPSVTDAGIAITAALLMFSLPLSFSKRRFVLDWECAERIPWGVLVLFGGGLALADAFSTSGLAAWIGGGLEALAGVPQVVMIASVCLLFIFLTELTSNTATASMGMPVLASLAKAIGADPLLLMATAAMASSMAFMLPVATPPNAIFFGSGALTAGQMIRAGIWLNFLGILVITLAMLLWQL